jgi:hypothetical protein
MDETSLAYDNPRQTTLELKGTKNIAIKTNGYEENTVTAVFAVTASGEKIPPFLIISGTHKEHKVPSKIKIPDGIIVKTQKKASNDIALMKMWIETILKPWTELKNKSNYILILDSVALHMNHEVKFELEELNVHPIYIPSGCTSFLQPLDISTNRSFKSIMRTHWEEWIKLDLGKRTQSGNNFKIPYDEFLIRVSNTWEKITLDVILNGWKKSEYLPLKSQTASSLILTPEFKQWLTKS